MERTNRDAWIERILYILLGYLLYDTIDTAINVWINRSAREINPLESTFTLFLSFTIIRFIILGIGFYFYYAVIRRSYNHEEGSVNV